MLRLRYAFFVFLALLASAALSSCDSGAKTSPAESPEIAVCGWDSVFILQLESPSDSTGEIVWSWSAADSPGLPDSMKSKFGSTDECKPVDGGKSILITSSGDGVALVERETKKVLFWASAVNAHSADLLPGGLVAVAASHRDGAPGDRLILFEPGTPGREIAHYELSWAHGVVWDDYRQKLFALGDNLVLVFKLVRSGGLTRLEEMTRIALPERGGHDMYPVPGFPTLNISTSNHCWLLDRDSGQLFPHTGLADEARVKCISVNPHTVQTAWIQAEGDNWWATRIRLMNPENTIMMPERKLYKVRWFID